MRCYFPTFCSCSNFHLFRLLGNMCYALDSDFCTRYYNVAKLWVIESDYGLHWKIMQRRFNQFKNCISMKFDNFERKCADKTFHWWKSCLSQKEREQMEWGKKIEIENEIQLRSIARYLWLISFLQFTNRLLESKLIQTKLRFEIMDFLTK